MKVVLSKNVRLDDAKPWRWIWLTVLSDRMSRFQYENWPRSVRIIYTCTFPVSAPLLMFSMMLGTIAFGLVLMVACVMMLMFSQTRALRII